MSMEQYERLRGAAWARLTETMDRLGAEAGGARIDRSPAECAPER